jgi:dihydrofolate reductase
MRRIRYPMAASLDGYILGPNGEIDWITHDPDVDFRALFNEFDTVLSGRRSFEAAQGGPPFPRGVKQIVFSRTLRQCDHPGVTVVADKAGEQLLAELRAQPGKDIWLFGGASLFGSLLDAGLVDAVEVAVQPVLLGGGLPLLSPPAKRAKLKLTGHKIYKTGIVSLAYAVE